MRVKLRSGTVICISTLLATQVKPGRTATLPVISPDFSNLEACLNATIEADINQDGIIQEYEYPDFLTSLGYDIIDHRNYDDLPITAKLNFMYLSCWCGKNISCCKGMDISNLFIFIFHCSICSFPRDPQGKKKASSLMELDWNGFVHTRK